MVYFFVIEITETFFFSFDYQILQMLNDSNPGVREAAILCIEVSGTWWHNHPFLCLELD